MPRPKPPYPLEFRRRLVELVRSGRSPESLAKEFEPSVATIRKWAVQMDRDEGRRADGLASVERSEIKRLRKQVRRLEEERDLLKKAAAWFARESDSIPKSGSGS